MPLGLAKVNFLTKVLSVGVSGPTFRSDAISSNLELALPFDSVSTSDDVAFNINGSLAGAKTKAGPGERAEFQTSDYYWGQSAGASPVGNAQISTTYSKFGGASAKFDGTDDFLNVNSQLPLTGDFTIDFWFYSDSANPILSPTCFISQYISSNAGRFLVYPVSDIFRIQIGGTVSTGTTTITDDTWHHVAVVRNGSSLKLYLNGTEECSLNSSYALADTNIIIGGFYASATTVNYDLRGYIDELRISNTALYTSNFTPPTTAFTSDANTLHLYHMDGANGSTTFIDSGYPDYGGAFQGDQVGGTVGGVHGLTYDLSSQSGSGFGNASSATYTLEGWFRATNATTNNNWCLSSGDSGGRWLFGINTSGTISFGNENNIGLGDSNWHHIAIVNDAGTHRFYLDGIYKGAWYSVNTGFNTLHLFEFNATGGANFRGQIQDFRVYQGNAKYSGTSTTSANFTLPNPIIESF